ncbi:hypothetical protein, conserved [Plasmodium gonderi]|uniref:Uncharacterized protein n=1 Tax=Plasmodium gonderi TaxID=77519 RepID=A0A1Y1JI95_PLAGO|nr:hypothetical protein, conserved [Plasmodium gonderi]GAW80907.1 hypothetical protein, conserved [Plasmodium gonderi]
MKGRNCEEKKNPLDSYVNRIRLADITGNAIMDKRVEYLWNLAILSVYENAKLSMKYIALIKRITNNNLTFDNICCHYCNLIYIPFYNCQITHLDDKNVIVYKCLLCNHKKRFNIRNCGNQIKNSFNRTNKTGNALRNPNKLGIFLINEIDEHEIKKEKNISNKEDSIIDTPSFTHSGVEEIITEKNSPIDGEESGINRKEDFPICSPHGEDSIKEYAPSMSIESTNEQFNQEIVFEKLKDLFTIDYGTNSTTFLKNISPFSIVRQNSGLKNDRNSQNLNTLDKNRNFEKKRKHNGNNNANGKLKSITKITKIDGLSDSLERSNTVNMFYKTSNENSANRLSAHKKGQNVPNLGNSDNNYLNFNKLKKKKRNILDIL